MIKTLLAVGLTALCSITGLKRETTNEVIEIDGENSYEGYNAQRFLSERNYQYLDSYQHSSINESLTIHTEFNTWTFLRSNDQMQAYAYLIKKGVGTDNNVELAKFNMIIRGATNNDYKFAVGIWNDSTNRTITKEINIENYEFKAILIPKELNNNKVFYLKAPSGPQSIMWNNSYVYNIKTYDINGYIAPYKNMGANGNRNIAASLEDYPPSTTPSQQQQIVNTWFISNGKTFNEFNIFGISQKVTYNPNTPNAYDKAELIYQYATYENTLNNYESIVNRVDLDKNGYPLNTNTYTEMAYRQIVLLEADRSTYINGIYQYQYGSLEYHITDGSLYQISGNTDISNIFVLIGNAFDGFGNFFGVTLLPGITIGALVTIPLLIGLILWLINMFKRH